MQYYMKIKVLIIEDEPVIAEMISMILEDEGFEVISLSDTGWARYKLQAKEVSLVMLDLKLKGEDGESICKYIKTHHDLKNIPVILVSGSEDIEEIKEKCGADDLIRKPFELNHFISKVHKHTGVVN
jgi:DNA-binding response OmpR family regulator